MSPEQVRAQLQSIWQAVLGEAAGVDEDDDFFDLGGDSLTAARMTSLARRADLPLRTIDVLKHPRFGDLVMVVCKVAQSAS